MSGRPNDDIAAFFTGLDAELAEAFPHKRKTQVVTDPGSAAINLGIGDDGQQVPLPLLPRFEHMHVVGATGSGKSTLLLHMIKQDILAGRGVCLFDPHGNASDGLFATLLHWLHDIQFPGTRPQHKSYSRLHVIDPNTPGTTTGFNPLAPLPGYDPSVIADAMLEAFERVWNDEDTHAKPTIRTVLKATFIALIEERRTIPDAKLLFDRADVHHLRARVISKLSSEYARDVLERLHQISEDARSRREFDMEVVGPINRLNEFVSSPVVADMLNATEHALDLRTIMDQGHVLLVNLQHGRLISEANASLIGTLLLRYLFLLSSDRSTKQPFFLYIDECHRFLSGDVPNLLAESRKFRLGGILAHQFMAQIGSAGDKLYDAVLNSTEVKAVFRVKTPEEAQALAPLVLDIDLEMPVQALIRPTVVGQELIELTGRSKSQSGVAASGITVSEGSAVTLGNSNGSAKGMQTGHGMTQMLPGDPENIGWLTIPDVLSHALVESSAASEVSSNASMRAETETSARSQSQSKAVGSAQSESSHQAFRSMFENLPSAVHSKDNAIFLAGEVIRKLPVGQALVRYRDRGARVTIPFTPKKPLR